MSRTCIDCHQEYVPSAQHARHSKDRCIACFRIYRRNTKPPMTPEERQHKADLAAQRYREMTPEAKARLLRMVAESKIVAKLAQYLGDGIPDKVGPLVRYCLGGCGQRLTGPSAYCSALCENNHRAMLAHYTHPQYRDCGEPVPTLPRIYRHEERVK